MRKNKKKEKHSPRYFALAATVDKDNLLTIEEALTQVKKTANAKFVESVDVAIRLGIDPRKSDQNVRGLTTLPHGTGKSRAVAVLAKGDLAKEAEGAGADVVGAEELITRIQNGDKDLKFDVLLATEEMAPQLGKIGRVLGARTPNKRNGTVTNAIGNAVKEIKSASRIEYRADKEGVVHLSIGKVNFTDAQLQENFLAGFGAVLRAKPSSAKGKYVQTITVSSSMGPGISIDPTSASKAAG
ncbi:MAG: 50S ribosomal protein L1 [Armatimonadetes bacterium]|nr:50S ribosomal protein L1 [Armatimonadota bacterium]